MVEDGEDGLVICCQLQGLTNYMQIAALTWGWIATFSGAVEGWAPTGTGPSGRARWRKESCSAMMSVTSACAGVCAVCEAGVVVVERRAMNATSGAVDIIRKILAGAVLVKHGPAEIKKFGVAGIRTLQDTQTSHTQWRQYREDVETRVDVDPSGAVVELSRAEAVAEEEVVDFEAQAEAAIEVGEVIVEEVVIADGVADGTRAVDVDVVEGLRKREQQSRQWMMGEICMEGRKNVVADTM